MDSKFIKKLALENKGWSRLNSSTVTTLIIFIISSSAISMLMAYTWGGYRPSFANDLTTSPRFLIEFLLLSGLSFTYFLLAISLTIPGSWAESNLKKVRYLSATLLIPLIAFLSYSLINPALQPSMLGKRTYCSEEILIYGIITESLVVWFVFKKRALFHPLITGVILSLAASFIPIALMHLGCMHDPLHIIKEHITPIAIVSLAGILLTYSKLKKL